MLQLRPLSTALCLAGVVTLVSTLESRQEASIPDFVTRYAPLVYIDINDPYLPSDIGAQVSNTYPAINFTRINNASADLGLDNLSGLNAAANCQFSDFGDCPLYLTSRDNVSMNPAWLYGVLPDPSTGETKGATSATIIVNDHGDGTVDAFYFYFYAFNLGLPIGKFVLGNHVGDWEHTMVRFVDSKPSTIWYSAHDGGFVYTYDAVSKNDSRPIVYSGLGGHANYPTPGTQVRKYGALTLNDTTSAGPLWDPVLSAYFYNYAADESQAFGGTLTPVAAPKGGSSLPPVDWLHYLGRWGDKQYLDSNPIQFNLANISHTYEDGPTGPLDKDLERNGTCPDGKAPCSTTTVLPSIVGNPTPSQTYTRTKFAPTSSMASTTASTPTGTGTVTGTSSRGPSTVSSAPSSYNTNGASRMSKASWAICLGASAFGVASI